MSEHVYCWVWPEWLFKVIYGHVASWFPTNDNISFFFFINGTRYRYSYYGIRIGSQFVMYCIALHYVTKNVLILASCSFDKHGLFLIIFSKQYPHTFKNNMHIQLSLSLHFYLFYLLLNSCDGKDANRIYLGRLLVLLDMLVALKRVWVEFDPSALALKRSILVQQMFKVMSFCLHARTPLSPLTNSFDILWYACSCVIEALVSQTYVLYSVHTFVHQSPNSVVSWVSGSTGLFGRHRSGEIKSGVSCWRSWTVSHA